MTPGRYSNTLLIGDQFSFQDQFWKAYVKPVFAACVRFQTLELHSKLHSSNWYLIVASFYQVQELFLPINFQKPARQLVKKVSEKFSLVLNNGLNNGV